MSNGETDKISKDNNVQRGSTNSQRFNKQTQGNNIGANGLFGRRNNRFKTSVEFRPKETHCDKEKENVDAMNKSDNVSNEESRVDN